MRERQDYKPQLWPVGLDRGGALRRLCRMASLIPVSYLRTEINAQFPPFQIHIVSSNNPHLINGKHSSNKTSRQFPLNGCQRFKLSA